VAAVLARPAYTTREAVAACLDTRLTARIARVVDEAVAAATGSVDGLCHRTFHPTVRTMTFDWPNRQSPTSWRLWLDADELVSVTSMTAGGVVIAPADYLLRPDGGPPYTRVEIDLSSSAAFASGDTHQRAISITGPYGYQDNEATAGTVAEALDDEVTRVVVTDGNAVGVGDLVRVDTERMTVVGKYLVDTAQDTTAALAADVGDQSLPVEDGTAYTPGETVVVDSERMLVEDVTGNTLLVERGAEASTVAAHATGAGVWAPRGLHVLRGAQGTAAASHSAAATLYRHLPPPLVRELATEEAVTSVLEKVTGLARVVGEYSSRLGRGDTSTSGYGQASDRRRDVVGRGLAVMRADVYAAHGRKLRSRAV
jgi:hypothetical protein